MMTLAPPPVGVATPEIVDGTSPMDAPILALTRTRYEDVTVENAAAHTTRLTEAEAAVRASSIASANRLAETCSSIPIADVERTFDCHYALGLVASPASLALLASHAMAPFTAPAADEHVSGPSAARLARQTAVDALADHARFGNDDARNVLVNVVREGDELTRAIASRAILLSFPRRDAKAALRDALPASEHWRMYEVRQ